MSEKIRLIRIGLRNHPGTPWMLFFLVLGWVAAGHWWGSVAIAVIWGPIYLWGAYSGGKANDR